jgi:hypothetical protein
MFECVLSRLFLFGVAPPLCLCRWLLMACVVVKKVLSVAQVVERAGFALVFAGLLCVLANSTHDVLTHIYTRTS